MLPTRGAQNSESLEARVAHIPGLEVVVPASPADAEGLLEAAIGDPNPVVFVEHEALYETRGPVPPSEHVERIGPAVIRRAGRDLTIVASSRMVLAALAAAERLAEEAVEAGAVLAVVETAEAAREVISQTAGVVEAPSVESGRGVTVGSVLCRLRPEGPGVPRAGGGGARGGAAAEAASLPAPLPAAPARPREPAPTPTAVASDRRAAAPQETDFVPASPIARRLAREHGVDLARVARNGADGRVREKDVPAALAAAEWSPAGAGGGEALPEAAAVIDPLLDESRTLAQKLGEVMVRHELLVWPGLAHGTLHTIRAPDAAVVALERLGQRLRRLFEETRP